MIKRKTNNYRNMVIKKLLRIETKIIINKYFSFNERRVLTNNSYISCDKVWITF